MSARSRFTAACAVLAAPAAAGCGRASRRTTQLQGATLGLRNDCCGGMNFDEADLSGAVWVRSRPARSTLRLPPRYDNCLPPTPATLSAAR